MIAAAGNHSARKTGQIDPVSHPANCPSILAVAALTSSLTVADYSCGQVGATIGQINIAAPGDRILSSCIGASYGFKTGTSMAAPFVAGVAALLWEAMPAASARDIWQRLIQLSKRLTEPASDVGAGLAYVK